MNVKLQTISPELIPFQSIFETTTKPKNDAFVKEVIIQLQKHPNLIEPLNKRIKEILAEGMKSDTPRYIRFILNEDNIQSKSDKQKSCCQTEREKKKKRRIQWRRF
jgi:hypothetical protein